MIITSSSGDISGFHITNSGSLRLYGSGDISVTKSYNAAVEKQCFGSGDIYCGWQKIFLPCKNLSCKNISSKNISIKNKENHYRRVSFDVVNNSKYDLEYVVYKIKFLFGDEYSLRKIVNVNNLESGDRKTINRLISVDDISGKNILIEVEDFKMKRK